MQDENKKYNKLVWLLAEVYQKPFKVCSQWQTSRMKNWETPGPDMIHTYLHYLSMDRQIHAYMHVYIDNCDILYLRIKHTHDAGHRSGTNLMTDNYCAVYYMHKWKWIFHFMVLCQSLCALLCSCGTCQGIKTYFVLRRGHHGQLTHNSWY